PGYEWLKGNLSTDLPPFPDRFRSLPRPGDVVANAQAQAEIERVRLALEVIPNEDIGWDDWNRIGMAIFAATGGSDAGLNQFHRWSSKSKKYDVRETDRRWGGLHRSPPQKIGAGTLFYLARDASPDWEAKYWDDIECEVFGTIPAIQNAV